jgi:hypothetical protein
MTEAKKEMSAAEREARAHIPASALADMIKVDYDARADLKAYGFATGGPCSAIPRNPAVETAAPPPQNTSGWQAERPLQPQPGIDLIDRMVENATARERAQAQRPDMMTQMMAACTTMMQMQSQTIQALAALVLLEDDKPKAKPKGAKDDRGPEAKP